MNENVVIKKNLQEKNMENVNDIFIHIKTRSYIDMYGCVCVHTAVKSKGG